MAFMAKFNVGDICERVNDSCWTVDHVNGAYIKITSIGTGYKYDILDKKFNKVGHCSYCLSDKDLKLYEPAKKEKEIEPPFYVDCPTREIWDKVEQKMFNMGYEWRASAKNHVQKTGERISIGYSGDNKMSFYFPGSLHEDARGTFIPYQEFLGEEDNIGEFKVGDTVRIKRNLEVGKSYGKFLLSSEYSIYRGMIGKIIKVDSDNTYAIDIDRNNGHHWWTPQMLEKVPETATEQVIEYGNGARWYFNGTVPNRFYAPSTLDIGKPIKSFTKRFMDTLRSIPDRLKRVLNPALSAFYKLGWIDGDLGVTDEGVEALTDFLFDKYEKELGEVAAKKIKEIKKKKKNKEDEE